MKWITSGESHGYGIVTIIEGFPAGIDIDTDYIKNEIQYRRTLFGRGPRSQIETDELQIIGGIINGKTIGAPIAILVKNVEYQLYKDSLYLDKGKTNSARSKPLLKPRPGHADLVGYAKYRYDSLREVLECASARETIGRVVVGAICKKLLMELCNTSIISHTLSIGKITKKLQNDENIPNKSSIEKILRSPLRVFDDIKFEHLAEEEIKRAKKSGTTLGGASEILVFNPPRYLGTYAHYDKRLDAMIANALISIPSVKSLRIGEDVFKKDGAESHDIPIYSKNKLSYNSNYCGGIEGGISNGEPIKVTIWCKPLPTVFPGNQSFNVKTGEKDKAITQRSDVCAIPTIGVISEAMLAIVITEALLRRYGEEHIEIIKANFDKFNEFPINS